MFTSSKTTVLAGVLAAIAFSTAPVYGAEDLASEFSIDSKEEPRAAEDLQTEPHAIEMEGELISTIALGRDVKGTTIEFYALPDGYGGQSVGVLEINRGGVGLADIPLLGSVTNPRELFHAFAEKGVSEPPLLTANYESPKLGKSGWARDVLQRLPVSSDPTRAVCNWGSFANSFDNLRPDINGTKYWYSSVSPLHSTSGGWYYSEPYPDTFWKNYASNARGTTWNKWNHYYTFWNVDKFKTKVRVCAFESGNAFQDRYVQFRYRSQNNVVKAAAYTKQLTTGDIGTTFTWVWAPTNGQHDYDWVTLVGGSTVWPSYFPVDKFYVAVQKK